MKTQTTLHIGLLIFFSLFLCTQQVKAQCTAVSESDSLELVALYNAFDGPSWSCNEGWLELDTPISNWEGITLTEDNCSVSVINLNNCELNGELSSLVNLNLAYLDSLNLSDNNLLTGEIPDFNNLPNLKSLDLSESFLSGKIPNFSNLPNLEELKLSAYNLSFIYDYTNGSFSSSDTTLFNLVGEIPDFNNLLNLKELDLSKNFIIGEIPNFNNLPNLEILNLNQEYIVMLSLTGEIPNFSNLTNLKELNLSETGLSGEIPDFNNLPNLEILNLSGDDFGFNFSSITGEIPDFSNLPNLKELDLSYQSLSGEIPDFSNLPNLETLNLSTDGFGFSYGLTGEIPNFSNLSNLKELYLHGNSLTGEITNFSNLPNLKMLILSYNDLEGEIPDFNNLPNLEGLYLYGNNLMGEIPNFSNLLDLKFLGLSQNNLTGKIPNFSNLPNLEMLRVTENNLTGFVPNFNNTPNLENLYLCSGTYVNGSSIETNNFIGELPSFEYCPSLNLGYLNDNCISPSYISGFAYHDQNNNNTKDPEEIGLPNAKIYLDDSIKVAFTDQDGYYTLGVETGSHIISYTPPFNYWEQSYPNSPNTYDLTLDVDDHLDNINFANIAEIECPALSVNMGTPFLRKCHQNTYHIEYCNWGAVPAEDAYIEVILDENIIPLAASIPYTQEDNLLTFDLGNIEIGKCNTFTFVDSISCDVLLGSTACIDATIFPNDICETDNTQIWDGSDLTITGYCEEDSVRFEIKNIGEDMISPTQLRIFEDNLITTIEMTVLNANELVNYKFPNGNVFHGIIEQTPNHPLYEYASDVVELCNNDDLGLATDIPDWDYSLAYESDCQEIIEYYDPNEKSASPAGIGDNHYIRAEDVLTYKIRFQNTRNDTAFTVIVIDTIDTNHLDISTFNMDNSSHDYELQIVDYNVLQWTFNNILLVDSNTNEVDSHGFLQFKIQQQANNPVGTIINNKASIYFDYDPITTNQTYHEIWFPDQDGDGIEDLLDICNGDDNTDNDIDEIPDDCDNCPDHFNPNQEDNDEDGIGDECESTSVYSVEANNWQLKLSPIPVKETLQISFHSEQRNNYNYIIYDKMGKVIEKNTLQASSGINKFYLPTSNWAAGAYIISITNGQENIRKKLFKH